MLERRSVMFGEEAQGAVDEGLRKHFLNVYNYMVAGLAFTAFVAWLVTRNQELLFTVAKNSMVLGLGVLGMSMAFGFFQHRFSTLGATLYFAAFAGLMGAMLAPLALIYTGGSIAKAFLMASAVFLGMSIYGYATKKDLSGWGPALGVGFLAVIVVSLLNAFIFKSSMADMALSAVVVLLSAGIIGYSTQEIKAAYYYFKNNQASLNKIAVIAAVGLYVNFINLFIILLRLFGDRR
jgi:uncharacterized protein